MAGVELPCSPEIVCTLGQARGGRACREWLHCGVSLPCLSSAVSLAQLEFRLRFPAGCGVALWMPDLGVEPRTAAWLLPRSAQDAE